MHILEFFIKRCANLYFLNLFFFITGTAIFLQGFKKAAQGKVGPLFLLYAFINLIIFLITTLITGPISIENEVIRVNKLELIIQLTELTTYFAFFITIEKKRLLKTLLVGSYLITLATYYFFYSENNLNQHVFLVTNIKASHILLQLLIFPTTLFYLISLLLKKETQIKINEIPSFWILTGALLYSGLSISLSILSPITNNERTIEYLFLIMPFYINALFIKKSFSCPPIQ